MERLVDGLTRGNLLSSGRKCLRSLPIGDLYRVVELSDLMRVHARRRHFDRSKPVEVKVAQSESKVLQLGLRQGGVVLRHVEVHGCGAALVRVC